ncbi:DUF3093 family protein [Streptomyces sp. NPDC059011]|uniref:DUF3093 family protein n=1 Tax=unclassified Streptomyces TaxID=2593676 RepID=UPI0036CDF3E6
MTGCQERLAVPVRRWPAAGAARDAGALVVAPLDNGPPRPRRRPAPRSRPPAPSGTASPPLRVQDGALTDDGPDARVERLGRAEILDADGTRDRRTFRAGPHARAAPRAYVPTAVPVAIADHGLPYRSPLVSTRHPPRVVRAVNAAKAEQAPVWAPDVKGGGSDRLPAPGAATSTVRPSAAAFPCTSAARRRTAPCRPAPFPGSRSVRAVRSGAEAGDRPAEPPTAHHDLRGNRPRRAAPAS